MEFSIRTAARPDVALICEIGKTTFVETYARFNEASEVALYLDRHFAPEVIRGEFDEPGATYLLAFYGEALAGYAKVTAVKLLPELQGSRHLRVQRIYVLQKFQGQRLGFLLMQKCIETARAQGFEVLWLTVWKPNVKAVEFYEKVGFHIFGSTVFMFGNEPQDDHLMKLQL